ncbi:MAG: RDD family protein [Chitinophagales bacterium]
MRTIDIITTQNVTINYELADVKDRIFAFILDQIIIWVSILILALILLSSGIMNSNVFVYAIVLPIIIFYHLFLEILFDGRSLGKMILGIRVVKLTGMEPSLNDLVFRWALRPVDILFLWVPLASCSSVPLKKGNV